jgi:hypothetical protein
MRTKIDQLRRIELAVLTRDRKALYKANKIAREHVKSIKKKELIAHWQRLIGEIEKMLNCPKD